MVEFFAWLEQTRFSVWVRESDSIWAFPMFLFMHTLGMSIVAGGAAVIDFALLGLWPDVSLRPLARLYPVLYWGFAINAITGVAMFMADATTRGNNTDFYVKMLFVFAGWYLVIIQRKRVFGDPNLDTGTVSSQAKLLAWASLACWFAAIVAGRLIAYVGPVAGL
jgi:hypothetical protein